MKRILTALVLIPVVLYLCVWAPVLLFGLATGVVAAFCFWEYGRLSAAQGFPVSLGLGMASGLPLVWLPSFDPALVVAPALAALALGLRSDDMKTVMPRAASLVLGVSYCFLPWRCAVGLRGIGPEWLVFALVINWIGDAAAFFVGSRVGRHKLAPGISPAKSWEGAAASVVAAMLVGWGFAIVFAWQRSAVEVMLLAVVANIAGQVGDLAESAFKRGAEVKDSGALLPGHGGWLDRVDSSLFSLPVVYFWLTSYTWL
jgi:phosphatidate cytidylyltransferase